MSQINTKLTSVNTPLMNEPASYQISFRLAALVSKYGNMAVYNQLIKFKNQKTKVTRSPKDSLQVHISNLVQTYGHEAVMGLYESIWSIPKARDLKGCEAELERFN